MTIAIKIYGLLNGQMVTEVMPPDYIGAIIYVFFYDAGGVQVTPVNNPVVSVLVGSRYIPIGRYGQDEWRYNGIADRVKVDVTGVTGYSTYKVEVHRSGEPVDMAPIGVFVGTRAMTVQNYTEVNVKTGRQYEVSSLSLSVPAAANRDIILITGNSPIVIKAREITFNGSRLEARAYVGPTYTGGVAVPYFNLNTRNPVAGTVQILGGVTVTNVGTEGAAPTYALGGAGIGSSVVSTHRVAGAERVLAANTVNLLRTTNTDSVAQDIVTYATWYEGGTDLPL
jgi:hypothetical protein